MHLLRGGIDSLYLAIQGSLPPADLERLAIAKEEAIRKRHCPSLLELGRGEVGEVRPHGHPGGYPFAFDTGPVGELWACRREYDGSGWNLFVKPHAAALLAHGYGGTISRVLANLEAMDARVTGHSVNRVDYAIDIRADDFLLGLDQFVKPARAKVSPRWGEPNRAVDQHPPAAAILCGRRIESVTVGRLPGWQVIVYDKTAEIRARKAPLWWEAWELDAQAGATVWRIELRAGKKELKERRQILSLRELEEGLRDVLRDIGYRVRYVNDDQTDSNVSRQRLHPIWELVTDHVNRANLVCGGGELPEQRIRELTLKMKQEQYEQLIIGNCAGFAAALGYSDQEIGTRLPKTIYDLVAHAILRPEFQRSVERARQRLATL
jgi:hypothetical protein